MFKKSLVILSPSGRLGNRLQTSANALAFCEEYGLKAKLYCLFGYEGKIACTPSGAIGRFQEKIGRNFYYLIMRYPSLMAMLGIIVINSTKRDPVFLTNEEVRKKILDARVTVVVGYYIYTDFSYLEKHGDAIRKKLAPVLKDSDVKHMESVHDGQFGKTVGIHIRRTDYIDYVGGEFYFEISHYESVARSVALNADELKVRFVICSDEEISETAFAGLDWVRGPGSMMGDLYALSTCDYVMGPHSTFNRWSAYLGNKPRYQISKKSENVGFSDFEKVKKLG
ncbi:hypothetical protein VDG1235_222 [Verrucomicrobiia bacterium DG1235]|nr:hypothetical protein VDG1235_222 [Verrucomicrobiae bacterium DG1235]